MKQFCGSTVVRSQWGLGLSLVAAMAAGCSAGAPRQDGSGIAAEQAALEGQHHGSGGSGGGVCQAADTTCDGIDDDCDGKIDENCDFGPANCPAGSNVIAGTSHDDFLVGTSKRDCILGYGGRDVIFGLAGDDVLVGGPGDDLIYGWQGDDVLIGGAGDDQLFGGAGRDSIEGGDGNDVIDGGEGRDTVHGGACHDTLVGDGSPDDLFGDSGSDRILGGRGHDHVDGGAGVDACEGSSCELPSGGPRCVRDADCRGGKRCVKAVGLCVAPDAVAWTDATCDGVDDDCDGKIDEDFVSSGGSMCVDGHETGGGGGCTPRGTTDSTCDGVDDDCDGHVDEEFASSSTHCGAGACGANGSTSCVNGAVKDSCVAGSPAADDANCNGIDDNCNGSVDEGYASTATHCGMGACAANGSTSCVNGAVQDSCVAGSPAADDANCNGVDDNCNGSIDEGYASIITVCGMGACASAGNTSCVNGAVKDSCVAGSPAADDANCNGVDDNCNGSIDEGFVPAQTFCGRGVCTSAGATSCVAGMVLDSCMAGAPSGNDADCNGIDENCNGVPDDGFVGHTTSCGTGACRRVGNTSCVAGMVLDSCTAGAPASSDATCDLIDDNCNGVADEDYVPSCSGTSKVLCTLGNLQNVQCADGNACNGPETCSAGACQAGTPPPVDDGNACTTDSCDPTLGVSHQPVPIDDSNPCTTDSCDPTFGVKHQPVALGSSCADSNVCNGAETCLPPHAAGCTTPASGLFAWWPGEGNANDVVSGLNGTLQNGVTFASAEVDQGFSFDGVDDQMDLSAHAGALNLAGQATIELWVRIPVDECRTVFDLRQDSTHEQVLQVGKCGGSSSRQLVTWTYVNGGSTEVAFFNTTSRSLLIDAGRFHHLALTFNGTTMAIYIDGSSRTVVGTASGRWGAFPGPVSATMGAGSGTPFQGMMDEVALFDHALSATQISAIFNAGINGMCKGPVCTAGTPPGAGTLCGNGGTCDGVSMCSNP
jgi:hypothetical protein